MGAATTRDTDSHDPKQRTPDSIPAKSCQGLQKHRMASGYFVMNEELVGFPCLRAHSGEESSSTFPRTHARWLRTLNRPPLSIALQALSTSAWRPVLPQPQVRYAADAGSSATRPQHPASQRQLRALPRLKTHPAPRSQSQQA
ncbi:hypothetical protein Anapl_04313 [Anas platyrhynchos]|uniref:Uncharacterized protein n=1 Tax=Anas platyrhynchos TaxID=8839 RepID=R0KTD6_ANAPL|nr:hypothetical protein Anapl_04313 [Anas platyrhynchos]